MKSKELIETFFRNTATVFPQEALLTAFGAFAANLAQALGVDLPDSSLPSPEKDAEQIRWATTMFYVGAIAGFPGEISWEKIKEAHLGLAFPWSRAIISRGIFGPGEVTDQGIPTAYGV